MFCANAKLTGARKRCLEETTPKGVRVNEEASMVRSYDEDHVELWRKNVLSQNRLEGTWDIDARFEEKRCQQ